MAPLEITFITRTFHDRSICKLMVKGIVSLPLIWSNECNSIVCIESNSKYWANPISTGPFAASQCGHVANPKQPHLTFFKGSVTN